MLQSSQPFVLLARYNQHRLKSCCCIYGEEKKFSTGQKMGRVGFLASSAQAATSSPLLLASVHAGHQARL